MEQEVLRKLATEQLVPFFSGASIAQNLVDSTSRDSSVAFLVPCAIAFKVDRQDDYRLVLERSQPFAAIRTGLVTELDVVWAFARTVKLLESGLESSYSTDLMPAFQDRVVAEAIASDQLKSVVRMTLEEMKRWGSRLYEGKPISAAIGISPRAAASGVNLRVFCEKPFSSVLSNGVDTLIHFGSDGQLFGLETLCYPTQVMPWAPNRLSAVADWAENGRIAFVLNRLGEILVFRDKRLLFARRSGRWHFLTHEPISQQMRVPNDETIRSAIYESCLDASFARTGAGISVVSSNNASIWKQVVTSSDDWLDQPSSIKSKAISSIIGGMPFHELKRSLRQELLAIDGATVMDHHGRLLAVGTIVKVSGGSAAGGRHAAAIELSKLGLGIKVSQDGSITGFRMGEEIAAFRIM